MLDTGYSMLDTRIFSLLLMLLALFGPVGITEADEEGKRGNENSAFGINPGGWKQSGGTMMAIFSSMGRYSKWGSWGLMEYHDQSKSSAPKYQAVLEFLEKNPRW